jgi:hypothetical protein
MMRPASKREGVRNYLRVVSGRAGADGLFGLCGVSRGIRVEESLPGPIGAYSASSAGSSWRVSAQPASNITVIRNKRVMGKAPRKKRAHTGYKVLEAP